MKEIKLPSGAALQISLSPFAVSKALYQALLKEAKGLNVNSKIEMNELYKEMFCSAFSSKEIEACLWECFKKCTYNGFRIVDDSIFESPEARQDYMTVCMEVGKENVLPFTTSLLSEFQRILAMVTESSPK